MLALYDEFNMTNMTLTDNMHGGYENVSDIIFAEWHIFMFLIFDLY